MSWCIAAETTSSYRVTADAEGARATGGLKQQTCASAHQEVGHGGRFLGTVHTLERFRECFYRRSSRRRRTSSAGAGTAASDAAARASDIWRRTLEEYEEPELDPDLKAELKAYVNRRRTELGD